MTLPRTSADCSASEGAPGPLKLTEYVTGLNQPLLGAVPWGDDERLFVIERAGRVQLIKGGVKTLFLDISAKVVTNGEHGLLGIAFHPDYVKNGRFFLHYSGAGQPNLGRTTIEEYRRDPGNLELADPSPVGMPYIVEPQPASNHNGGSIEFSPVDGLLYIGLGDGGGAGDTFMTGQNPNSLLAKLLRIDISTNPHTIPPGNMPGGRPEIFHTGLRNPFRFSFDACSGDAYIGDVGQGLREEIDIAAPGVGSINWGWSVMEGSLCYKPMNCDMAGLTLPAHEYDHSGGKCSVTGGVVYRGASIPWLRGAYLYGEYCTGQIWMLRYSGGVVTDKQELTSGLGVKLTTGLVGFFNDNKGNAYLVHAGGKIYRVDAG